MDASARRVMDANTLRLIRNGVAAGVFGSRTLREVCISFCNGTNQTVPPAILHGEAWYAQYEDALREARDMAEGHT